MIERHRIIERNDEHFDMVWELYQSAFPIEERRALDYFCEALKRDAFHCEAVLSDGRFIGLFCWWELGDFGYVEYFATVPEVRGGGYGRIILEDFLRESNQSKVVIEVEHPLHELNTRRIGFYERMGFVVNSAYKDYYQPSYSSDPLDRVPLLLMSYSTELDLQDYERFCDECSTVVHFNRV